MKRRETVDTFRGSGLGLAIVKSIAPWHTCTALARSARLARRFAAETRSPRRTRRIAPGTTRRVQVSRAGVGDSQMGEGAMLYILIPFSSTDA